MARPFSSRPNFSSNQEPKEFDEKVVQVNRVSKKTKGGNSIGFSVLVVVGDKNGRVGVGLGKAPDVLSSIQKATRKAKKKLIKVPIVKGTIPFSIHHKKGAAQVLLKPAPVGTGVIAGGAVRAVVEAAGIKNIVSKIMGTNNQANNVYATFAALEKIRQQAAIKGLKLETKKPAPNLSLPSTPVLSKPQNPKTQTASPKKSHSTK